MAGFNIEDPAKQEKIRRESHEFQADAGRLGTYVAKPYAHREYPKVVGYRDEAKSDPVIVHNAEEEKAYEAKKKK